MWEVASTHPSPTSLSLPPNACSPTFPHVHSHPRGSWDHEGRPGRATTANPALQGSRASLAHSPHPWPTTCPLLPLPGRPGDLQLDFPCWHWHSWLAGTGEGVGQGHTGRPPAWLSLAKSVEPVRQGVNWGEAGESCLEHSHYYENFQTVPTLHCSPSPPEGA